MAIDPRIQCWWEEGIWPVERKDEVDSRNFEDVRKRVWLLGWPGAGYHDLAVMHGTYDDPDYVPFDSSHWTGLWDAFETTPARIGQIIVLYKDAGDVIELYTNCQEMLEADLEAHPPIVAAFLDSHWKLYRDPNRYAHWNRNAGKPVINAEGRWMYSYHGESTGSPPCEPLLTEYISETRTRDWLPRQLNLYRQIAPVKEGSTVTQRHSPVEQAKSNITGELGTAFARTSTLPGYAPCVRPARQTEYILDGGEPQVTCTEESEASNQCAADAKINDAYQAHVIAAVERAGHYVKPVDDAWKVTWLAFQPKSLWAPDQIYTADADTKNFSIVYLVTEDDPVLYVCYLGHTSATDNKPGSGANWTDYWKTPVYQPEYFYFQPVYAHLGGDSGNYAYSVEYPWLASSWFWACNDSAYELCLRDLGKTESVYPLWAVTHGVYLVGDVVQKAAFDICKQCKVEHTAAADKTLDNGTYWEDVTEYDWWWDTGHPAVPWWLYRANHDEAAGNWPLPRGCWRRTWKHSAGRLGGVGSLMWPGEKGDPPGYNPTKCIVLQAIYDAIPTDHQKYYAVVAVETLHAAAYGEAEEALIAARHDPVFIRHVEYEAEDYPHPIYEMHHDIINDLRNALLQLHLMDDNGVTAPMYHYRYTSPAEYASTSLAAYAAEKAAVDADEEPDPILINESYPVGLGGDTGYTVGISYTLNEGGLYRCEAYKTPGYLDIFKYQEMLSAFNITDVLYRIGYRGVAHPVPGEADGCEVGFGDKTLFRDPEDPWLIAYVRLKFWGPLIDKGTSPWTEHNYFDLLLESEWPEGDFFDWEGTYEGETPGMYVREISICRLKAALASLPIVFETDWDKVLEIVFDEDESNAIVLS